MTKNLGGLDSPVTIGQGGTGGATLPAALSSLQINPTLNARTNAYVPLTTARGTLIHYTGGGGVNVNLNAAATYGNGWNALLRNDASADITIVPNGAETIDGNASFAVAPGQTVQFISTGATWYTFANQGSDFVGANIQLSNLGTTAINQDLLPDIDSDHDIGSLSLGWDTIYVNTIADGATGTTQAPGDDSLLLATTQYVDNAVSNLILPPTSFGSSNQFICSLPGSFGPSTSDNKTQTMDMNANVWFVPFYFSTDFTMSNLRTFVVVGQAATTLTMGIYASTLQGFTYFPNGAPLVVGSVASIASLTGVNIAASLSLSKNVIYFAAIQLSSNVTLATQVNNLNLSAGHYASVDGAKGGLIPNGTFVTSAYSAGTLPTVAPIDLNGSSLKYDPIIYIT
jgi:hypothetical protein